MPRRSAIFLLATASLFPIAVRAADAPAPKAVLAAYSDLALAMYGDSLTAARQLDTAVEALLATPSEATLAAARDAWRAARVPYQQTEVFRFGNPVVDDWEGRVNAWPLDEGLIDYVDSSYGDSSDENPLYTPERDRQHAAAHRAGRGRRHHDHQGADRRQLHEALDVEKNVAIGYHAIEFLLWGQDLNGTGPGAGNRPWTDLAQGDACTNEQLRPAAGLSRRRDRAAGRRSGRDGGRLGTRTAPRAPRSRSATTRPA